MNQRRSLACQLRVIVVLVLVSVGSTPVKTGEETLVPVIVELFTSQGCSSCPPADALLGSLTRNQTVKGALIIPLSEHVDSWNRLGWRDPFSSARFTERQKKYARQLQVGAPYTPMMIIDGRQAFVGSQSITAREAIMSALEAPKANLTVTLVSDQKHSTVRITITVETLPQRNVMKKTDIWLAVTEHSLHTKVTHGENAFRTLGHTGVVRLLNKIDSLPISATAPFTNHVQISLEPSWKLTNLNIVGFLQETRSRHIVGATQVPLS